MHLRLLNLLDISWARASITKTTLDCRLFFIPVLELLIAACLRASRRKLFNTWYATELIVSLSWSIGLSFLLRHWNELAHPRHGILNSMGTRWIANVSYLAFCNTQSTCFPKSKVKYPLTTFFNLKCSYQARIKKKVQSSGMTVEKSV